MTSPHQRARELVNTHWNGDYCDRGVAMNIIALALAEQRERDAQVVCDGLIVFSLTNSQVDAIARTIREGR